VNETLRIRLRSGRVIVLRNDPQIPAIRRALLNCMVGMVPYVVLNGETETIKIYTDDIVSVV
jgi:hypothetical protein